MNSFLSNNRSYIVGLLAGFCLYVYVFCTLNYANLPGEVKLGLFLFTILFAALLAVIKCNPAQSSKPQVHVWSHNGFIRLCAHEEYEHAIWDRERIMIADPGITGGLMLDPQRSMVFSKHVEERHVGHVYPMDVYDELIRGCIVEKSEMYLVPLARQIATEQLVFPEQMYRLIWGADAEVPDKLKA